jgi:glutamate-ammonia-ligase adenylyltransferase
LRKAKQETALLVALADIGGVWQLDDVTHALTAAADMFVSVALAHVLRTAHATGKLRGIEPTQPEKACGLVVLALGKHGAKELNYSSDTDLVVFFDPSSPAIPAGVEPAPLFVRLTQMLVRLLQERTADGYVLRVDLRLRPDPGSTAIAISLPAAFSYYETLGQNWERAALIKARPIAGDIALGEKFLAELAPFIWRKYFDYCAIDDIHAMKRQIHAVRGYAEIAIAGHDLKLGRGGIREIEFFVQTQQLIFGGRRPKLRGAQTLAMLEVLQGDGWITKEVVADLAAGYVHLRWLEHRLQMLTDEQTQRLPADENALKRFANFCGFGLASFEKDLNRHFQNVERHYTLLFENAPGLHLAEGNLVFTGATDDPETLETLKRLGFKEPQQASETVRGWHFGHRPAVQSPRAREVLTKLVPSLLEAFGSSGDPDAALKAFDQALSRMPAAVELFSILKSNATVRRLFADILGGAPRLAEIIARQPHVLDAAIDPSTLNAPINEAVSKVRLATLLQSDLLTEQFLDAIRDIAREEMFLIGLRLFSGLIEPIEAGFAYSALAANLVQTSLEWVEKDFAKEFGVVPVGRCAVVALGRLGSREMTAVSDLDLMLIYDFDAAHPHSVGAKSIHAVQYYIRLAQRLISSLTVATRNGRLYEVDMRLRPSGRKGPVATQFKSFIHYQMKEAETWEHMVLTRARVISGDATLAVEFEAERRAILAKSCSATQLKHDIFEMRRLIAQTKGEGDRWDLKLARGGLLDIEFLAQFLSLLHAADHADMTAVAPGTLILNAVRHGFLEAEDGECLASAYRLYSSVMQILRLSLALGNAPHQASESVKRRLASAAGVPDFRYLERELTETRGRVRAIFNNILRGAQNS